MSAINYVDQLSIGNGAVLKKLLSVAVALDFGSLTTLTGADLTIAVPGAVVGDPVVVGAPNGSIVAGLFFFAWVSASDVVTVRALNLTALSLDPVSGTYRVAVLQF